MPTEEDNSRGRWLIRRIHNTRMTSVVKKMMRGVNGEASGNERGGEAASDDGVGSTTVVWEDTVGWVDEGNT